MALLICMMKPNLSLVRLLLLGLILWINWPTLSRGWQCERYVGRRRCGGQMLWRTMEVCLFKFQDKMWIFQNYDIVADIIYDHGILHG